uniref:Uncharacterized protein n=1 Tax=Oryza glaberrima TaxID=4538 RepID=I1R348_ORYGL
MVRETEEEERGGGGLGGAERRERGAHVRCGRAAGGRWSASTRRR